MPSWAICSDSLALRVMASSSASHPNSRREPAPHVLDVRLEDLPHVVHGRLVGDVEVALERLVHHARAGAHAAVVEVDDRAVEGEGRLDLAPVGLVLGHVFRRPRRDGLRRLEHALEAVGVEGGQRGRAGDAAAHDIGRGNRGDVVHPWHASSACRVLEAGCRAGPRRSFEPSRDSTSPARITSSAAGATLVTSPSPAGRLALDRDEHEAVPVAQLEVA